PIRRHPQAAVWHTHSAVRAAQTIFHDFNLCSRLHHSRNVRRNLVGGDHSLLLLPSAPALGAALAPPLTAALPTALGALLGEHCHRTKQENHHHGNQIGRASCRER